MNVSRVVEVLESIAPPDYAESWDNVGLLIGAGRWPAERVMLTIDLTEEVLRVPMAMRWGERIRPGQRRDQLVSLMDLPATVLDAAEGSFGGPVDGQSLLPLVTGGEEAGAGRDDLMIETHGHHGERVVGRAVVTDHYKYAVYRYRDADASEDELYDLREDPYELKNLISDPALESVAADMKKRLDTWRETTGDTAAKL